MVPNNCQEYENTNIALIVTFIACFILFQYVSKKHSQTSSARTNLKEMAFKYIESHKDEDRDFFMSN
jgi:hypothetical protein